jgi:hypothetical protein
VSPLGDDPLSLVSSRGIVPICDIGARYLSLVRDMRGPSGLSLHTVRRWNRLISLGPLSSGSSQVRALHGSVCRLPFEGSLRRVTTHQKEVQVQSVLERVVQLNQENSEIARRIGLAACESFDECLRAQMDASRELLQGHAVGLAGLRDNAALAKLPAAYLRYWQKVFENARDWFEAGVRTQATFARILFEHANSGTTAIRRIDDSAAGAAADSAHQRSRERHRHAA